MANSKNTKSNSKTGNTNKSKSTRNKSADSNIVNVVKKECCPKKAANPMNFSDSTAAYAQLAKVADRFL